MRKRLAHYELYCSRSCKHQAQKARYRLKHPEKRRVEPKPATCRVCGTGFLSVRPDACLCSARCRNKVKYLQKRKPPTQRHCERCGVPVGFHGQWRWCKNCKQAKARISKYGLTWQEFDAMVAKQGGRCSICHDRCELVIDHCHKLSDVRGLLCKRCNSGLGFFRDSPSILRNAAAYVGQCALGI